MKTLLAILVLSLQAAALAQSPIPRLSLKEAVADFPRSQLELRTRGPVSFEVKQDIRAAYEALADMAGLSIIFDADFRSGSNATFRIENADILEAFDLLSTRSGSFVEVLNAKTVIVAPDNPTKRRDYELLVLKTFYLPNGTTAQAMTDIVTMLRKTLQARYIAISTSANAIVMRDTTNRVALAEKTIALSARITSGVPTATQGETIPGERPIVTQEAGTIQSSVPARSLLKLGSTRPVSMDVTDSTRSTFESLASAAGLNIVFDGDFRSQDHVAFKVSNIDALDAIDLFALQTRTFSTILDSRTIMVAPDNQAKRREFETVQVRTYYLPNTSQLEMTEIVTALRTILNCRYLATVSAASAIVMRDTPGKMVLAERIITDLRRSGGVVTAAAIPTGSEGSFVLGNRAARALVGLPSTLQSRVKGTLSFDMNDSARTSYEAVAAMAGLRVVFDDTFKDVAAAAFKLQNVEVLDALDFLALQTRSIWRAMDKDTIFVAPDNQTVRSTFLSQTMKTINLRNVQERNSTEIVTALRTILNLRQLSPLQNSIVIHDTAENIALAERIVSDLDGARAR